MSNEVTKLSPREFCDALIQELDLDPDLRAEDPLDTPVELDSLAAVQILAVFEEWGVV